MVEFSERRSEEVIFEMCFMRNRPNMIKFDVVDFSERRSEEVIFEMWFISTCTVEPRYKEIGYNKTLL